MAFNLMPEIHCVRCHERDEELYLEDEQRFLQLMNLATRLRPLLEDVELTFTYQGWKLKDNLRALNTTGNFILQHKLMLELREIEK